MTGTKLNRGAFYNIELYPREQVVRGRYVGDIEEGIEGKHVFEGEVNGKSSYMLVDKHWISVNGNNISHKLISSFSIQILSEEEVEKLDSGAKAQISKLVKMIGAEE